MQQQTTTTPALVRMTGVAKRFGPVPVLRGVNFDVRAGEVHILAGENGAGKSTLMKILGGVYGDYDGTLEINGKTVRPRTPREANALGVSVIYQELSLVGSMSVADNIFLGRTMTRGGFVRDGEQRARARELLRQMALDIDVDQNVEQLPISCQQLVEIAKALAEDARVIVMDEPTSALSAPEVTKLFALIAQLKSRGCGIVYITHKMEEIRLIGDRITVLRDGQYIGTAPIEELPTPKLIEWMVGRQVEEQFPRHAPAAGAERLAVENFSVYPGLPGGRPAVDGVSFTARRGEIVGIGGLQGSGASELFLGLFGAYGAAATRGTVTLDGSPLHVSSPPDAIRNGVALLTNDRKATGLVLSLSITANATLAALGRFTPSGWRRPRMEEDVTETLTRSLRLRCASLDMEVGALSGGNQQKVAIAKWLASEPKVLLLDEPTRGIDIGAKRDIYQLMDEWTARGITILLITSELPELLAMSDRIIVMHRGKITAHLGREQATADRVLRAAMGQTVEEAVAAGAAEGAAA